MLNIHFCSFNSHVSCLNLHVCWLNHLRFPAKILNLGSPNSTFFESTPSPARTSVTSAEVKGDESVTATQSIVQDRPWAMGHGFHVFDDF